MFGSRAGGFRGDSDWDILIVTKEKLDRKVEEKFWLEIEDMLVRSNIVPEIIIIVDKETFEKYRHLPGFVYYWAEREGILLK